MCNPAVSYMWVACVPLEPCLSRPRITGMSGDAPVRLPPVHSGGFRLGTHKHFSSRRRDFLRLLAGATVGLPSAKAAPSDSVSVTRVTNTAFTIAGAGCNILVVLSSAGPILVDNGLPEHADELVRAVSERSGRLSARLAFNTHWHVENTGSNEVLAGAGSKIIAHENTRLTMGMDLYVVPEGRVIKARRKEALPTETFIASTSKSIHTTFGGEPIEYGYLPQAHTDGDIYVYFPRPNILMAGDVASVGSYPVLDNASGGWIGGMSEASKTLLSVANDETRIIPGKGPAITRTDLKAQSEMLSTVFQRLVKLIKQGMGPKDMIAAAPTKEFDSKWGSPDLLISSAYRGLWGHARELGGVI